VDFLRCCHCVHKRGGKMTLDEAILHCEEVADRCAVTDGNRKCEADHRQLAEWLRELKMYREKGENV